MIFEMRDACTAGDCHDLIKDVGRHTDMRPSKFSKRQREIVDRLKWQAHGLAETVFARSLNLETILIANHGPGHYFALHADNCKLMPDGTWGPNHTPNRVIAAMYYLNSNFEGGELVFPQQELTFQPAPGLLLIFPADRHHTHEVMTITKGRRYNLSLWMVDRDESTLPYSIYG